MELERIFGIHLRSGGLRLGRLFLIGPLRFLGGADRQGTYLAYRDGLNGPGFVGSDIPEKQELDAAILAPAPWADSLD